MRQARDTGHDISLGSFWPDVFVLQASFDLRSDRTVDRRAFSHELAFHTL